MTSDSTAVPLPGYQKRHLRALAQHLEPVVRVGAEGLSPGVLRALDEALEAHELVKIRLYAPEDKRAAAAELARAGRAALVHLIGHTVVLYRPRPDDPRIVLPERGPAA